VLRRRRFSARTIVAIRTSFVCHICSFVCGGKIAAVSLFSCQLDLTMSVNREVSRVPKNAQGAFSLPQ